MKLEKGLTVVIGNNRYKNEIPDELFKKFGLDKSEKKKLVENKK